MLYKSKLDIYYIKNLCGISVENHFLLYMRMLKVDLIYFEIKGKKTLNISVVNFRKK